MNELVLWLSGPGRRCQVLRTTVNFSLGLALEMFSPQKRYRGQAMEMNDEQNARALNTGGLWGRRIKVHGK